MLQRKHNTACNTRKYPLKYPTLLHSYILLWELSDIKDRECEEAFNPQWYQGTHLHKQHKETLPLLYPCTPQPHHQKSLPVVSMYNETEMYSVLTTVTCVCWWNTHTLSVLQSVPEDESTGEGHGGGPRGMQGGSCHNTWETLVYVIRSTYKLPLKSLWPLRLYTTHPFIKPTRSTRQDKWKQSPIFYSHWGGGVSGYWVHQVRTIWTSTLSMLWCYNLHFG